MAKKSRFRIPMYLFLPVLSSTAFASYQYRDVIGPHVVKALPEKYKPIAKKILSKPNSDSIQMASGRNILDEYKHSIEKVYLKPSVDRMPMDDDEKARANDPFKRLDRALNQPIKNMAKPSPNTPTVMINGKEYKRNKNNIYLINGKKVYYKD